MTNGLYSTIFVLNDLRGNNDLTITNIFVKNNIGALRINNARYITSSRLIRVYNVC